MFVISEKKRGRPKKFEDEISTSRLEQKKIELFNSNNSVSEYTNLINLAYQTCKINKQEFELGIFLEKQYNLSLKYLELKTLPKNSPNTWNNQLKISTDLKNCEVHFKKWQKSQLLLKKYSPKIAQEFINLISSHHTYEELLILKMNQKIMQILKDGLKTLNQLIELGYL